MLTKAIFLDRDGTINIDKNYIYRINDFELIPKATDGMKLLQAIGFKLIIISNQSGIARGYFTEDDYYNLNNWLINTLMKEYGIKIDASYFCPHHPEAKLEKYRFNCNCRKPKLGMFEKAIIEQEIDINNSFAIGDKLRDLSICEKYESAKGYLIGNNESKEVLNKVKLGEIKGVEYTESLFTAAVEIARAIGFNKF